MKCLFIDTSSPTLSLAIIIDNQTKATVNYKDIKEHSKYAMIGIAKVFKEVNLKPDEIDRLIIVNGPGSFTGIRIGLTIAKVYAWALNKEIISISALKAYALANSGFDYYITILKEREDYGYLGIYDCFYNELRSEQYIELKKINNIIDKLKGNIIITSNIKFDKKLIQKPLKLDFEKIVTYLASKSSINPHQIIPNYIKEIAVTKLVKDSDRCNE